MERREAAAGIERALALSEKKTSIFPEGKDRWTSYVRDHQGTLLMSLSEYEAQAAGWGMTDPRYLDSAGKSRLETTAKLGANQYYVYPYGVLQHKGFLYSQLQGTEYTGKTMDEGTQWYYFHARHYDSLYGRFIGHDLVAPDLNNPLTLNPFLYCLNNPGRWVDPDGRDFEFWSFESAFDFAFQTDFGESSQTFVEKAPDRLSKIPGFLATKGVESGGDMIQAVPSSVYSGVALATAIEAPIISAGANYLGVTKSTLDYREGLIGKQEYAATLLINVAIPQLNPAKISGLLGGPIESNLLIRSIDNIRAIPAFFSDLYSDFKYRRGNK